SRSSISLRIFSGERSTSSGMPFSLMLGPGSPDPPVSNAISAVRSSLPSVTANLPEGTTPELFHTPSEVVNERVRPGTSMDRRPHRQHDEEHGGVVAGARDDHHRVPDLVISEGGRRGV